MRTAGVKLLYPIFEYDQSDLSSKSTPVVGIVVALLVIGAVASIFFYQVEVAGKQPTSTTTQAATACKGGNCVYVNMTSGASSCTNPSSPCGFDPATVTVVIGVNNTVVWTNQDQAIHTVSPLSSGATWGSNGAVNMGDNYTNTFTVAGTYQYHCDYHPGMIGEVVVEAPKNTASSATASTTPG